MRPSQISQIHRATGDALDNSIGGLEAENLDKCRTYLSLVASVATPVQLVANVASWS
jgi:hypothetical protein